MRISTFLCFVLLTTRCFSQEQPDLKGVMTAVNAQRDILPVEKIYVHTDKPYYITGDTLRFKAYLLNGDFLTASLQSGLLYIELIGSGGQLAKRQLVPVNTGLSWGQIVLDGMVPEGSYTLRAYTNWMRNFGDDYIFKKDITVSSPAGMNTLVRSAFTWNDAAVAHKNRVNAVLQFTDAAYEPWRLKDLKLRVMNGKRGLYRSAANTGVDGKISLSFEVPDKIPAKRLSIRAQQTGSSADTSALIIPVKINRPENTDVQFLPEGGTLLTETLTKIGFKALSEDGIGVAVSGKVLNSKLQEVVSFATTHTGMGSFQLLPVPGESYTAKISIGKAVKDYPMPAVKMAGTTLSVTQTHDSLTVTINAVNAGKSIYYLIGQARGVVCYAQMAVLNGRLTQTIAKNLFPTGIGRFTLLDAARRPLNERQVFVRHQEGLKINVSSHKQNYLKRDSIALNITVKNKDGIPVKGNFSLAVTDDSQIRPDSLGININNSMLLTTDLKGTIEDPGYYFRDTSNRTDADLDNLLLTQGWVGYDWKDINTPKQPVYKSEKNFAITGKVTNVFGKGVDGSGVTLFSQKPLVVMDTQTDKNGVFTFNGLFPVDTAMFRLTARSKKGKDNVGIEILNEFRSPAFEVREQQAPWYVNSDPVLISNTVTKNIQIQAEADFQGEGRRLKEVVIKGKKIVRNSKHVIEPGSYDQVFDEQDMLNARKMSLTEFLLAKVKGFEISGLAAMCTTCPRTLNSFVVDSRPIYFVIDGISLNQLWNGNPFGPVEERDRFNFLKPYADFFNAEDIIGIEVMTGISQITKYTSQHIPVDPNYKVFYGSPPFAFIEITTRSGHGPFQKKTSGSYLYRPLAFTVPKQFYRPRYTSQNKTKDVGTDLRSTIHWEPNVMTNANGQATVSFFSADKAATYSIILEGTNLNGEIGYTSQKLLITDKP